MGLNPPRGASTYYKAHSHLLAVMNHAEWTNTSPVCRVSEHTKKFKILQPMDSDNWPLTIFLKSEQLFPGESDFQSLTSEEWNIGKE